MQLIIDTNVVLAYLISGYKHSSNAKVCKRVVSGSDKAFTCDILYGELKRLLDLDPDLIEKISQSGKKEGDVFHALDNVRTEYLNSRLDPYVMQLNFVKTENLWNTSLCNKAPRACSPSLYSILPTLYNSKH